MYSKAAALAWSRVAYRCKKYDVNVFNSAIYSGALTPTLAINATDPSQSGAYTLTITNACGVAVSDAAAVEVLCAADFNGDGGIDGADVSAFFESWEGGGADVNGDGGVDGADVQTFFGRWEEGSC